MRRPARLLLYLGTVGVVVGLSKVHASRIAADAYDYTGSSRFSWSIGYIMLLIACAYGVGLPDLTRGRREALGQVLSAVSMAALGVSVVQLALGDALLPRYVVFGAAVLLVPWYMVCSEVARGSRTRAEERDRVVLVLAEPREAEMLRHELDLAPEHPATIVGSLSVEAACSPGGQEQPLVQEVMTRRASVVVLDRVAQADAMVVSQAATLHASGVRVRTLSLFYEEWLGKLPVSELERVSLMFDIGELHRARYGRLKRLFDVVVGVVGIVVLVPATPLVVLGNLAANRGPLLFRQERVGKDLKVFKVVKFRTMRPEAGGMAGEWTTEEDPRITPFGRILRRMHIDELPQLANVLRGELSLVGPRPEQPRYVEELRNKIPFYDVRHLVRPGLTGWAQVKYGYAGSESDALEKLQYEFYYLRRQGSLLDLRIIGRTLRHVMGLGGR